MWTEGSVSSLTGAYHMQEVYMKEVPAQIRNQSTKTLYQPAQPFFLPSFTDGETGSKFAGKKVDFKLLIGKYDVME